MLPNFFFLDEILFISVIEPEIAYIDGESKMLYGYMIFLFKLLVFSADYPSNLFNF